MNKIILLKMFALCFNIGYSACASHHKSRKEENHKNIGSPSSQPKHQHNKRPIMSQISEGIKSLNVFGSDSKICGSSSSVVLHPLQNTRKKYFAGKAEPPEERKEIKKKATWPSITKNGDNFIAPSFPADVNLLMKHYHLMYPMLFPFMMPSSMTLEEYFSQNIDIIKSPPPDPRFVTNTKDIWGMCIAISRNGMFLPENYVRKCIVSRREITIEGVRRGENVPAIKCLFILKGGAPTMRLYITNGPEIYTYFLAAKEDENPVILRSFFHQYRDDKQPTPNEMPGHHNRLKHLMYHHIQDLWIGEFEVFYEIRKPSELAPACKNVLADMVKRYHDKMNMDEKYRYIPKRKSEEAIRFMRNAQNRFVLAKIEGVIIGMATFQVENKGSGPWKTEIKYFVEYEFLRCQSKIFKDMIRILKNLAQIEIKERPSWELSVAILYDVDDSRKYALQELGFGMSESVRLQDHYMPYIGILKLDVFPESIEERNESPPPSRAESSSSKQSQHNSKQSKHSSKRSTYSSKQ